jgi:tryptophan-rich sensory protein
MDGPTVAGLAAFLGLNVAAASSGAFFKPGQWYERLAKPWWRPPNWLFGPAWAVLYALNAIAGWLVWREAGLAGAGRELALYAASLVLNAGWSGVFFGLRRPDLAFGELVLLWLSIAATIAAFAPLQSTAAWMLAPYLAWVTFAGALNFAIWRLNRARTLSRE